ncbi:MAG TPA: hypothetical protein VHW46_11740 [Terracidiphilus sp.]|nr:hypothetical protein [Terracidiphilus sp.]
MIRSTFCATLALAIAAIPGLSQTVITSPTNGESVGSPFTLNMTASSCSSKSVTAVGYSLDNSSNTSSWPAQYINGPVAAPGGWHTLHVKVWTGSGAVCVTDVSIDVAVSASTEVSGSGGSVVPSTAVKVSAIQALGNWITVHDGGTSGSSSGTMSLTGTPSMTGTSRLFANQFNNFGGQRYSVQFDDNTTSQNFFYDAWVYIAGSSAGFANLEFDLDQTMPNGQTVVMGFQCDSWIQRWDYAVNGGSPTSPNDTWLHSYAPCNVSSWGANQWHHVQIYFSHDENGWVTYHSVWLDGNEQDLNFKVFSGYALAWGPAIVTNFQVDGNSSGTTWGNVYLDELSVYRW